MKIDQEKRSKSLFHAKACLFLVTGPLFFTAAYSRPATEDTTKKEIRQLLAQLQNAELSAKTDSLRKEKLKPQIISLMNELDTNQENIRVHNLEDGKYQDGTSAYAAFAARARRLNTEKDSIVARLTRIGTQSDNLQSRIDSLKAEIGILRNRIRLKSFDVKKFFNSSCGKTPDEDAPVPELKAYWDCIFDGTSRNLPGFRDPVNPGGMKITPNDPNTVIIPQDDPAIREEKQRQIRQLLKENGKKPQTPVVVPPPSVENRNQNPGSLSEKLKEIIREIKDRVFQPPPRKYTTGSVRG